MGQEDTAERGAGSLEEMREKSEAVNHTWQQNLNAEWFGAQGEELPILPGGKDCWTLLWHPFSLFSLFVILKKKPSRISGGHMAIQPWFAWGPPYEKNSI